MLDDVPITVLTELTGISETAIRDLARRGIVIMTGHRRYQLAPSIRNYCAHLRQLATGHGAK